MQEEICKCCGQTLPRTLDFGVKLGPSWFRIAEIVHKAGPQGIRSDRLFDKLYASRLDGGPLTGIKVLHVRVAQLNRKLRTAGWQIAGEHTGNAEFGYYRLKRLPNA